MRNKTSLRKLHERYRRYKDSDIRTGILEWMDARDRLALYYATVGMIHDYSKNLDS